jgi:phosphatidylglycerophosphate synthase
MTDFQHATRKQESLLAPAERRCLGWLAERMPAWVNSDHLTALGLFSMAAAGGCYAAAALWRPAILLVAVWLAINWFGDSLDGTLARVRRRLRPRYGFYVDHIVDAFGTLFLVGGLGLSGYMSGWVALFVIIAYFLLSIDVYLATYTIGTFEISFWKFSPTELRILLAIGNTWAYFRPEVNLFGSRLLFFDVAGVIAAVAICSVALISTARHTMLLYRAERV